jgi:hypothetical protein
MSNDKKHTPLPWSVELKELTDKKGNKYTDDNYYALSANERFYSKNHPGSGFEMTAYMSDEDVNYLREAVNSYAQMQARIKELEDVLRMFVDPDVGEVYVDFHKVLKKSERTKIEKALQSSKQL